MSLEDILSSRGALRARSPLELTSLCWVIVRHDGPRMATSLWVSGTSSWERACSDACGCETPEHREAWLPPAMSTSKWE